MDSSPTAWAAADRYLADTLVGHDTALEDALRAQHDAGLPEIEVAPVGGKLLNLLVRIRGRAGCSRSARSAGTRRSGSPARWAMAAAS